MNLLHSFPECDPTLTPPLGVEDPLYLHGMTEGGQDLAPTPPPRSRRPGSRASTVSDTSALGMSRNLTHFSIEFGDNTEMSIVMNIFTSLSQNTPFLLLCLALVHDHQAVEGFSTSTKKEALSASLGSVAKTPRRSWWLFWKTENLPQSWLAGCLIRSKIYFILLKLISYYNHEINKRTNLLHKRNSWHQLRGWRVLASVKLYSIYL